MVLDVGAQVDAATKKKEKAKLQELLKEVRIDLILASVCHTHLACT